MTRRRYTSRARERDYDVVGTTVLFFFHFFFFGEPPETRVRHSTRCRRVLPAPDDGHVYRTDELAISKSREPTNSIYRGWVRLGTAILGGIYSLIRILGLGPRR